MDELEPGSVPVRVPPNLPTCSGGIPMSIERALVLVILVLVIVFLAARVL